MPRTYRPTILFLSFISPPSVFVCVWVCISLWACESSQWSICVCMHESFCVCICDWWNSNHKVRKVLLTHRHVDLYRIMFNHVRWKHDLTHIEQEHDTWLLFKKNFFDVTFLSLWPTKDHKIDSVSPIPLHRIFSLKVLKCFLGLDRVGMWSLHISDGRLVAVWKWQWGLNVLFFYRLMYDTNKTRHNFNQRRSRD